MGSLKVLHVADIDLNSENDGIHMVIKRLADGKGGSEKTRVFLLRKSEKVNKTPSFLYYFNEDRHSFLKVLESSAWDLIVFHTCFNKYLYRPYKQVLKRKIPYIITSHGCFMKNVYTKNFLKKHFYKAFFIDKFVKNSEGIVFHQENERKNSYYSNKNYVVIPNIIDSHNSFDYNLNNKQLRFTSISRIDLFYKRIDLFIEALEVAKKDFKKINFIYEIYGTGSEKDIKRLEKIIASSSFRANISFQGAIYKESKIDKLSKTDIFIQMSSSEGMSVSISEALSCATPCFVSNMVNLEDDFSSFNCGWIVELEKFKIAEGFLRAIKCYLDNKGVYRKNARECAEYYFKIGSNFGEFSLRKYKKLLKN
jgi:glycosyltransferase involved in cell wall biosynthesis